jgi:hypothetical protein
MTWCLCATIEDSVLGRGCHGKLSVCDKRLLATYSVEDGIREPHIVLDHAWALGQTEAWDDTLVCSVATDTLHQAPLVIVLSDEAQSLASAQTQLVGKVRLEGGRDDHETWERLLWC